MAQHAAKGSGKITSAQNPLTGATVKHSAKRWAQINRQYQQKYGPLNLTGPMSPFDVKTSIDAATHQKFDPQYQTLNKQTSASNQQDKNLTDWYADYKRQIDAATAKSQAAQQSAQNFTQGFADSSSNLDAQQRQKLQADNQASAAQRGATVDPNQAFTGQQADQSRRQALGQFGALQAQTGADTTAYMADKSRIASGSELQAHQAEGTRRQGISELVRQLQGQEGDYRTTLRGQLQASERQNNLANATFGLNVQKAANDAAPKPPKPPSLGERTGAARDRYQRQHHLGPYAPAKSGETPAEKRARQRDEAQQRNHTGPYAPAKKPGGKGGPYLGHDQSYQTAFKAAYTWLYNHPGIARGYAYNDDSSISAARKATGASYGATYDALKAILKKYPRMPKPSANLL